MLRAQLELWIELRDRNTIVCIGRVQKRLCSLDVRALTYQFRGHDERQFGWQREIGQHKSRDVASAWCTTREHRQPVFGLLQLLAQCWQFGARLLCLGLQAQHFIG